MQDKIRIPIEIERKSQYFTKVAKALTAVCKSYKAIPRRLWNDHEQLADNVIACIEILDSSKSNETIKFRFFCDLIYSLNVILQEKNSI